MAILTGIDMHSYEENKFFSAFHFADHSFQIYLVTIDNRPAHITFSLASHKGAVDALQNFFTKEPPEQESGHELRSQLHEYLTGERTFFELPISTWFYDRGTDFQKKVWDYMTKIPYGMTTTYGELARRIGSPGSARAIGNACSANPLALLIPCHRVIGADGLGGFNGGIETKKKLLKLENSTKNKKD